MEITTPTIFNYQHCLNYLKRSEYEILFEVVDDKILKLFDLGGNKILIQISENQNHNLEIEFLNQKPNKREEEVILNYVIEWFDLNTPLELFYESFKEDSVIAGLINEFYGLRLIKVPDLFEALCWSVIGQQINLRFAYQVKKNLVSHCDNVLVFNGKKYHSFPSPEQVLSIDNHVLKSLQFSKQKIIYIKEVANSFFAGKLNKEDLLPLAKEEIRKRLTSIKGIGNWSANYVMMRTLNDRDAFPIADVGLHNALKTRLGLAKKPSIAEIEEMAKNWTDWKAYITFYLWRSLY